MIEHNNVKSDDKYNYEKTMVFITLILKFMFIISKG